MPLILAVRNHPGQSSAPLRIDRGEVVIGRGAGAHLLLASPSVSRRHCTVSGEGQNWRVVDSSSGGTFVNGQRIDGPHFLRHGDVVVVGEVEIAVAIDQAGMAPASAAQAQSAAQSWDRPAATQLPAAAAAAPDGAAALLLQAAGLARGRVAASDQQVVAAAGAVLRAALTGLARLAQDRSKARADLGVGGQGVGGQGVGAQGANGQTTGTLSPDDLAVRLLSAAPADAAAHVEALCAGIDAHQRAVLGAMQAGLHHTLDQFSPAAIKTGARGDAEAWKAYERAFDARDGFVEVFAQALAKEYAAAAGS